MFAIRHNGIWLKLRDGARLTTTQFPPSVNENSAIRGPLTYSFDVDIVGNENFFNFNHIKSINAANFWEGGLQAVRVYIDGIWWQEGSLKLVKKDGFTISLNLIVGISDMISLDKKLSEFDWASIALPVDPDAPTQLQARIDYFNNRALNTDYDHSNPEKTFNFPMIKNDSFYQEGNENNLDYLGWINNFDGVSFVKNDYGNYNAISPQVNVLEILHKGFEYSGYKFLPGELGADFDLLLQYNNYDLCKMKNALGVKVRNDNDESNIDLVPRYPNFNNTLLADGNYDDSNLWNIATKEYEIKRPGRYRVKVKNIKWSAPGPYAGSSPTHVLLFNLNIAGVANVVSKGFDNEVAINENEINEIFEILEDGTFGGINVIGLKIKANVTYEDELFPAHKAYLYDGTTIEIENLTRPQFNQFADYIDLSKCVPQEVLFREYLNAFASTWNVEFQVDWVLKTVTAVWIEAGLKDKATHREYAWNGNAEQAIEEWREPRYSSLSYQFDGRDQLLREFKTPEASMQIGDITSYADLKITFPPDRSFLGKYILLLDENAWYLCESNTASGAEAYSWNFYSDNYSPYNISVLGSEKKMVMCPVFMRHSVAPETDVIFVHPEIKIESDSPFFKMQNKEVGIRVFFYRGLCELETDDFEYAYPLASPLVYATNASINTTMRIFALDSEDSIILSMWRVNWRKTLEILNLRRVVTKKLKMNLSEFFDWNFRRRARMNGMNLYTEELTISTAAETRGFEVEGEFGIEEVTIE